MTAATSRLRRRGIGAGVAALVGLTGLGLAAVPAQAAPGFDPSAPTSLVAGADRFETAAKISAATFTSAQTVVIANGDRVIDAQAAGYVAGQQTGGAPILLTRTGDVPASTLAEIDRLGATRAVVVGDDVSVSDAARQQLTNAGLTLTELAGDNRFDTAADIYNTATTKAKTVFLARGDYLTGQVSPDALAAGPIAYKGTPILLTNAGNLPAETKAAITSGGVTKVVVLGNGITDAVKNELRGITGVTVETIAGDDRSLTARELAESAYGDPIYNDTSAAIANGEKVDALSAGPWAAIKGTPILLTLGTNAIGTGTTGYLDAKKATLTSATVFGDQNSVPAAFLTAAKTAGGGDAPESNQTFTVAPAEATVSALSSSALDNTGRRTFTVSGITSTTVDIALLPAEDVTTSGDTVSFATGTPIADGGGVSIELLNGAGNVAAGASAGDAAVNDVAVTNGTVSFAIDAVTADAVIPVVFDDANDNNTLDLTEGQPTEAFGVGGATTYVPAEAADNSTVTTTAISSFDTTADYLVLGSNTYYYDAQDTFRRGGTSISLAAFEALLSAGDAATINYRNTPGDVSTFNITTDAVPAPTNLAADVSEAANDEYNVGLTWTASAQGDVTYSVSRTATGGSPTVIATGLTTTSYTDEDVADDAGYTYSVTATGATSGVVSSAATVASVVVPPVNAAPAILANGAVVDVNVGAAGATSGDVWNFYLSEPVAVTSGAAIQLTNGSGPIVENGINSTFALNAARDVLTVTLTADVAGTPAYAPLVVNAISGVADAEGSALTPAGDANLENNGPEIIATDVEAGDTTFTVTFNEAVIEASAENLANYDYVSATGVSAVAPTAAVLGADGRTVTLTVGVAVGTGASIDPTGVVDTDGQASAQGAFNL
ncbi:cell wall-binding repeat-containing protein [Kineococcus sp. SYSU DK001]|uniref:cell wall-binding repeat-containing protein n=1 Tax=Kineococcus sp. SYSU DK001 TaxID=3383122 RepID=UPI003D7CB6E7